MGKIHSCAVVVCMLLATNAWGIGFKDDFDRPDGDPGNGWSTQTDGTITVEIVDGEVLIAGTQGTDWVRCGISRPVTDETRVSCDFLGGESFNFHIRVDDQDTSAFLEIYTWGGPLIHANSPDGGWPGWTDITTSAVVAGEYNNVELELIDGEFVVRLNGEEVAALPNATFTNIGSVLISSDSAAGTTGALHVDNVLIGTVVSGAAKEPSPANGISDVRRDVMLGWIPGDDAVAHDVYFGTSIEDIAAASRANPMGVLVSQGQTAATYELDDLLDFGTTYYWRIDEVNAAPDNTIFAGEIWSFTAEPFTYPVQNIVATSDVASDAGAGPENTVNGSGLNANGQHSIAATDMWLTGIGAGMPSIQFEFDRVYKLDEMLVWNYNVQFELVLGFGAKDVTVEYSLDGVEWMVLGDIELGRGTARADYAANTTVAFDGIAAQYVRMNVNSGYGVLGQIGLSEVQFTYIPAHPRTPDPANGATDVAVDTALAWRPGRDAVSHEVSLSTDPDALTLVDAVSDSSYDPGPLQLDATYYWQINEVQDAESWAGDVWSFSTQASLVVDDFESYDDVDNVIYDSWIDGWTNETGSTVGYLEAPFAEKTIVRSGRQSMPLFYDNTSVATSEADFDLNQNWTTNGIASLSLYFYGDPTNSGGQLYVKINNTKVAYDGDAADLSEAAWQPWSIDLSTVGNVSSVSSLTIGIEGAGAAGIVYIDDILLYP